MVKIETIKEFSGRILGYIETDTKTGNKTAKNFYGIILGWYNKNTNLTTNFQGRILSQGDTLASLIHEDVNNKNK